MVQSLTTARSILNGTFRQDSSTVEENAEAHSVTVCNLQEDKMDTMDEQDYYCDIILFTMQISIMKRG